MKTEKENSIPSNDWEPTCDRFVGYIDIMGFKDMVARNTHRQVYEKLKIIAEFGDLAKDEPVYSEDGSKLFIFSDSVIMFSMNNAIDERDELLYNMQMLMETCYEEAIPFRGAVAYGNITVDDKRSIFFGQPLIDAHLLSEELGLYSIAVHHTAQRVLRSSLEIKDFVFQCDVPFKNGNAKHLMICPSQQFLIDNEKKNVLLKFKLMTSGSLRRYIDNTGNFLRAAWAYKKANPV